MPQRTPATHSYLFTVRVWWEDLGAGQTEWRGAVKLVTTGEEHFFRDWATLGQVIAGMVPEAHTNALLLHETMGD